MSDDANLYLGRLSSLERGDAAAHDYWMTDTGVKDIIKRHGIKTSPAHLYKHVGKATMDVHCADCSAPAVVTSRSDANGIIYWMTRRYKPEPYRCKECARAHREAQWREQSRKYRERQERIEHLRWMPYKEYLGTSEWAMRRRDVIRRAGFMCQVCASEGKLHVHHRTYARRGHERPEDMIALCADCHELFHTHGKLAQDGRAA